MKIIFKKGIHFYQIESIAFILITFLFYSFYSYV